MTRWKEFVEKLIDGMTVEQASKEVGVNLTCGREWSKTISKYQAIGKINQKFAAIADLPPSVTGDDLSQQLQACKDGIALVYAVENIRDIVDLDEVLLSFKEREIAAMRLLSRFRN